ncbi:tRNA-processing RNAse BN [Malonomonas rubra DSM 5091]|uniref:tRNA-processing RNAse BN n=1 Tax=Malonomonas rubra DSM 5091 TaxID=1122189 RepID=A0A1M6BK26_MALRU|nr:YihY/virulence factor BrkB family protein [Malonomonas rubra]SHI48843.1 tRNA-processing RNAse BN [Malonomonas rubra DSM 5091]
MAGTERLQKTLQARIKYLLWEQNPNELNVLHRMLLRQIQTAVLVVRDFGINQSMLRASALTYYTMLSIVPLLALTFALLKAFGVQNLLEPLIMEKLKVGDGQAVQAILGYINNTQVGSMGAIGLIFLLYAVVSLLTNVEKAFNHVWGVREVRPLMRRFADYLSVILVGPVLIISAISMTSSLASNNLVQKLIEMEMVGSLILLLFKVTPFVFMWLAFTVLYVFMSNIRVEWRAAFMGGIAGGTLWQMAQWGYVNFQVGVAKYNAIYGTMAALPIFMIWVYLSWVIVLFGLGVAYAKQNLRTSGRDLRDTEVSRSSYEQVALVLLVTLADRFSRGEKALTPQQLAKLLFIPNRLCRNILQAMTEIGLVSELCSRLGRRSYQLGRSAEHLALAQIFKLLRDKGEEALHLHPHAQTLVALEACEKLEDLVEKGLAGMSLSDMVAQCQGKAQQGVETATVDDSDEDQSE